MSESIVILKQIIEKGTMIGKCAKLFENDSVKADQFIKECAQQCHNKSAKELWGEKLTKAIIEYNKKHLHLT